LCVCGIVVEVFGCLTLWLQVGWTPLIIASSAGHSEIVAYLLELSGVNIDAVNSTGQTAMHYAASKDRLQVGFHLN